jgi:cell division protein FtsB
MPAPCLRKTGGARSQIVVENREKIDAIRYPAVLIALAAYVQYTAVIGAADVADVGIEQFVSAQAGQQAGEDDGAVGSGH